MGAKQPKAQFVDTSGNPLTLALLFNATEEQDSYTENPATGQRGYHHLLVARVVSLRNTWDVAYVGESDHAGLADLEVRARQCATSDLTTEPGSVYGQFLGYREVYTVGLERAEAMAAMLRALAKAEDRAVAEDGYPLDWPETVRRVAKALGISQIVYLSAPGRHSEYVYLSLLDGISHIRTVVSGWRTLERRQLHEWLRPARPCRACGKLIETARATPDHEVICYPCSDKEWRRTRDAQRMAATCEAIRELEAQTGADPTTATDAA